MMPMPATLWSTNYSTHSNDTFPNAEALVPSDHHIFSRRGRTALPIDFPSPVAGPVSGEYVVGPPAKQQVERRSERLVDLLPDCIVHDFGQPTAKLEITGRVFLGTAAEAADQDALWPLC